MTLVNRTPDVEVAVLVDGRRVASVPAGGEVAVRLSPQRSLLATLPETSVLRPLPRDVHVASVNV